MFKKFNKENVINSIKQNRNKIIAVAAAVMCLAAVFWWGGNMPGSHGFNPSETPTPAIGDTHSGDPYSDDVHSGDTQSDDAPSGDSYSGDTPSEEVVSTEVAAEHSTSDEVTPVADGTATQKNVARQQKTEVGNSTADVPTGKTADTTTDENKSLTCTISVSCATVLNNLSYLKEEKKGIIPSDGIILSRRTVTFNEGESVFNVLQREMKRAKIHLEFTSTPVYDSIYIEGINNLYEFDCGDGSGWMYSVNGVFPGYGCNQYKLNNGDEIKWLYSCNLGKDVGGGMRQGK